MILEHLRDTLREVIPATYVGEPPSHVTECVGIRSWGGALATEYFGGSAAPPATQRPNVLFVARSKEFSNANTALEVVQQLFNRYSSPENGIDAMFVRGNILYLGQSEEHVHEFQLMFKLIVKE